MTFVLNVTTPDEGQKTLVYKDIKPETIDLDGVFLEGLKKVAPYTMTLNLGIEALYNLFHSIKYLCENAIEGDVVECGVWRGGMMMMAAHALQHWGQTHRQLYLFDTYDGMPEPEDNDIDFDGKAMKTVWQNQKQQGRKIGFGGTQEQVRTNLMLMKYPEHNMHFVAGDVLDTIPAAAPASIALLRLDTDWYKSTRHELEHLYGRVVPNGLVIIDDYGWCQGAREATDEFLASLPFKPMLHRINTSIRVLVKPA